MENTNRITVKAEYTVPQTTEIDSLLKELAIAKQITAQTKEELTPLIMAEGKAKYDAIMEQLQPIVYALEDFSRLTNDVQIIRAQYGWNAYHGTLFFEIRHCYSWEEPEITFNHSEFDWNRYSKTLCSPNGLITQWNQHKIIDDLKRDLSSRIKKYIDETTNKTVEIKTNYAEMHS